MFIRLGTSVINTDNVGSFNIETDNITGDRYLIIYTMSRKNSNNISLSVKDDELNKSVDELFNILCGGVGLVKCL